MRLAYADPPYPGLAHYYRDHPDYAGEVDHAELIERLEGEYDGWVLHTNVPGLRDLWPLAPTARVLVWHKTWASFKPGVWPSYSWEPVLMRQTVRKAPRNRQGVPDVFAHPATTRRGLKGAKPDAVIAWLFRCLLAESSDTLDDLFPGTGVVGAMWKRFLVQPALAI